MRTGGVVRTGEVVSTGEVVRTVGMGTGRADKLVSNGEFVRAGELGITGGKVRTADVGVHWRSCISLIKRCAQIGCCALMSWWALFGW